MITTLGGGMGSARWSIASRIFALQLVAVIVLSGCLTGALWVLSREAADDTARRVSLAVSTSLASDPFVIDGVQSNDPTGVLEPYTNSIVSRAGVDFVTIMSTTGIRFTHPDPNQIGKRFLGTISEAQRGQTTTETYTGTLGPSVRAVVPIFSGGRIVGLVSAGVTVNRVLASLGSRIPFVVIAAILLVLVGTAAALVARRFLARVTGAMNPVQLERMVDHYQSVLHSVREGLVLTDEQGLVVLYNDEAAELLGLPPEGETVLPLSAEALGVAPRVAAIISGRDRIVEEFHLVGHRVLLVNQEPVSPTGAAKRTALGSLLTLRDRTEIQRLAGELESVRTLSDALRSQTHEYANRLHTVVSLLELGRSAEAIELISLETERSQSLADDVVGAAGEPVLAALLLGKVSQAAERGIQLRISVDENLGVPSLSITELVSVVGNLIDNALDAASAGTATPRVTVTLSSDHGVGVTHLEVSDSGSGIGPGILPHIFERGFSTKPADASGRGFGLAVVREIVQQRAGEIEVRRTGPTGTVFAANWPIAVEADGGADDPNTRR